MFRTHALLAALALSSPLGLAQDIPTRFGSLQIDDEHRLLYKKRPFSPEIQGNNSLDVLGIYPTGNRDVVLIQDNGGTACPAQYYFISLSSHGASATSSFGTCSDLVDVKQTADAVTVTMPGFMGEFAPGAEQRKTAKQKHVFLFRNGVLTENGKIVR